MRTSDEKSVFLETLKEMPFISYAAKKSGIARSTIYRWMKDNQEFNKLVTKTSKDGRDQLVDLAEMMLVKLIKEGNLKAITFFLMHNSKRYLPTRSINITPTGEMKPGQTCEVCGQKKERNDYSNLSNEELKKRIKECAETL